MKILRNLFAGFDVTRRKESNLRESQILMIEINANWNDVGCARVVEEATDVPIEVCINAML